MTEKELFIILVDNDIIHKSDIIVLLEGDGFFRYMEAVNLYKLKYAKKIIFSGGAVDYQYGSFPFKDIRPKILEEGIPMEDLIHESKSMNTKEQATEIIKLCKKNKWYSIILVGSHYHQYRAYLTFLKSAFESGEKFLIFNSPSRNLPWFTKNDWGSRLESLEREFERIDAYSKLGHLVSYKEAIEYQKWKEKN